MDITKLIGETTEYDKKEKLESRKPRSWCKSVSAFANGNGGFLIFGINNDDQVVGLDNAENDAEIISEQIKVYLDPIPEFELSFYETENDKKLILLKVFAGYDTPYYYNGDGTKVAFQRIGNESVKVDRFKLKSLVLKGSKMSFDSMSTKYKLEDFSFSKLKATYKQATNESFNDSDFESFGLIDTHGFLTNAGALIADDSPIRYSRIFCTRWNGLDKAGGVFDAIDDKEYADGLIQLLNYGVDFVKTNSKVKWKKGSNTRIELPEYGERAVFEAIVNALIHRDYLDSGSEVHIDMFDDRLVIYSPGGMVDGSKIQDIDILTVSSKRRNPIIADVFNRLKLMERRGSGFKKILEDYQKKELYSNDKNPLFYSQNESFFVELKNLNYIIADEEGKSNETNGVINIENLDDTELLILRKLKDNPTTNLRHLEDQTGLNRETIRRRVNSLEKSGFLKKEGTTQNRRYIVLINL